MERTEGQLCTRLTNSLCSNDTGSLAKLYHTGCSKVTTITLHTYAMLAFTGEHRTDLNHFNRRFVDNLSLVFIDFLTSTNDDFARCWVDNIVNRYTAKNAFIE